MSLVFRDTSIDVTQRFLSLRLKMNSPILDYRCLMTSQLMPHLCFSCSAFCPCMTQLL